MSNVKHISGEAGGYLVGRRHSTGGIKAINKSTGQPLEMEGGEVVITRNAVSDPTKRSFNGKMMTNREILSTINQSGGGVAFADGGEVPDNIYFDMDEEFEYGGKVYKGRDLPAKMTYGTELDDILDSALEEGAMLEEGGQVGKSVVEKAQFFGNGFDQNYTRNFQDVFSWVRVQNLRDSERKTVGLRGVVINDIGNENQITEEIRLDLLEEFPSGTKMSDIIARVSTVFRNSLTRYNNADIDSILSSFANKVNPTIGGLEGLTIYQPSSEVKEVTSSLDESSLIEIQEYGDWQDIWPKSPNYKGYESFMRKVIKGLPDYAKSEVIIKLKFRTLTAQSDGRAIGVVYVPVKLDMRKVKWSEMKKRIKDKLSWNVLLDTTGEYYHIVLDAPDWGMFEADEYAFNNTRANAARGKKIISALKKFQEENKDSGAINALTPNGLYTSQDNVEIVFDHWNYIEIHVGGAGWRRSAVSFDKATLPKADYAITDSEIYYHSRRRGFFRFFLDAEAVERIKKEREEAERLERERKAEEARIKAEAEEAERLRKQELANRPFQVRDQPEDEELFDGELIADTEERRLILADIEAVKRLLRMAQGQSLVDTRVALLKKLKRLEAKKQQEIIRNESMDVEAQKLISPLGLMNYYFTQARQNPTSVMGKPSGLPTPTGVPSKLDIQSYYAVRTRYFKRWFGDWELAAQTGDYSDCSLLVDKDTKEPRLMFHGVPKYIKGVNRGSARGNGVKRPYGTFKSPNFPATYFGDDIEYVKFYADEAENYPKPTPDYEGFIYTIFINMRRPIFIDDLGKTATYADLLAYIKLKYGLVLKPDPEILKLGAGRNVKVWNFIRQDKGMIEQLKQKGFDGIIQIGDVPMFDKNQRVIQDKSYWGTEYLVFEPTQVKSATVKKSFYLDFFDDVRFKDGGYVRI